MTIKTHASLFSGIGGAEIAATQMGWENIFHCEINPFGRKVLEYWYPNSESYEDITKTDFTKWGGKVDVLTAGFPCQPYSLAGQRRGDSDNRALWPEMLRAIHEIQPAWVVGENVYGILSMVQPGEAVEMGRTSDIFEENHLYREEQRYTVDDICESLECERYSVQPFVIPACAVGAPHRRDRVWFLAKRDATDRPDTGDETLQCARKDRVHAVEDAANTDLNRQWKRLYKQEPIPECERAADFGHECQDELVANTDNERLEIVGISKGHDEKARENQKRRFIQHSRNAGSALPADTWSDFPTQSPVCSRDDELSSRLVGISFSRWRQESIKALGNAWVPQVAYEIFRIIEQYEREINK